MDEFFAPLKHHRIPDFQDEWPGSVKAVLVHKRPTPDEQVFLEKMTAAFHWKPEALLQVQYTPETRVNYQLLWARPGIKLVLVFGITLPDLGIHIQAKPYHLTPCHPFQLYFVDPLDQVARSREMKAKLWNDLQKMDLN